MPEQNTPSPCARSNTNTAQVIMAFDFGTQKMGMAVGATLIESATPLALFNMKDGIPD